MSIKSLNTTSVYSYAERAGEHSLTEIVMAYSLLKNGTIEVEYDMIEDAMYEITNRSSPFFAKYAIDKLIKKGTLQLVYNDTHRLTNAIPFFKKRTKTKSSMVINITNFSSMKRDGSIRISPNTLYALLLSAAFTMNLDDKILSFSKDTYIMYSRLFSNIVANLSYMDNIKKEKIQYLASNFYYYSIYGTHRTFNNPYMGNLKYNSKDNMTSLEMKLPMYGEHSAYASLQIFIENLNKVFPEMRKLTFKNFVDRWASSYGSSTLFASEYLPYFLYMIISTACLSPAVNINKISTEVSTNLTSVYKKIEQNVEKSVE